jgi:hypothetical protein
LLLEVAELSTAPPGQSTWTGLRICKCFRDTTSHQQKDTQNLRPCINRDEGIERNRVTN